MKSRSLLFILVLLAECFLHAPLWAAQYDLRDLYGLALKNSEKILITREQSAIARLNKDKALSVLIPKVSAFGGYVRYSREEFSELSPSMLIQPESSWQHGLRVDQQFSLSLREVTALSMANTNIEKSREDLLQVQEEYLLQVAQAYYLVLQAGKNREIAQANLERLMRHQEAARQRLAVGEVTKTVVLRAQAELSGARADNIRAENDERLARSALVRLVGLEEGFTLKEQGVAETPAASLDILQEQAWANRADLKSLAGQITMARQQVRYARGAFWPNISLSGVVQKADADPELVSLVKESQYAALALSFPFFEGGLRKSELAEAQSKERQACFAYADQKKSVALEVQSAYLDLLTQRQTLQFLHDELASAKDNYHAITRQFEVGLATSVDVIDANTLLVSSERKLIYARYACELAGIRIRKVTGMLGGDVAAGTNASGHP